MRILVLAGTGSIGKAFVKKLALDGHSVYVTSRSTGINSNNITYLRGNAKEISVLLSFLQLKKWDVVVDFLLYNYVEFESRFRVLLENSNHYVFVSSARVYANNRLINDDSDRLYDIVQDDEFLSSDEYAISKAKQEDLLIKSQYKNWDIIRPYVTFNNNRLQLGILEKEDWLYRVLKGRTLVFSLDIASKITTLTYAGDVARILSFIVNCPPTCRTYTLASEFGVTWSEVLECYKDVFYKKFGFYFKVKFVPSDPRLYYKPDCYQIIYDRVYNRQFQRNVNILPDDFEFCPTISKLSECFEQFLENIKFRRINWKYEALRDRLTGEYASLKEFSSIKDLLKYCFYRFIK